MACIYLKEACEHGAAPCEKRGGWNSSVVEDSGLPEIFVLHAKPFVCGSAVSSGPGDTEWRGLLAQHSQPLSFAVSEYSGLIYRVCSIVVGETTSICSVAHRTP